MITHGADQWLEGGHKAMIGRRYYPQGECRLSLLVPATLAETPLTELLARQRIATSYPNLAREYLGVPEERLVRMTGAVETTVGIGWADCVFDVVESGETARANGLVELRTFIRFGAVLATCRREKIPLFVQLKLIPRPDDAIIVAFDGNDGTGKSMLARRLVQGGLWNDRLAVLVSPYSGDVGRAADDLRKAGMLADWAGVVGRNHWRAPRQISAVYDRSLLTCLTDLLDAGVPEALMARVAETWKPYPHVTFLCTAPTPVSIQRIAERGGPRDEFSTCEVVERYQTLYRRAAEHAREKLGMTVVELDTTQPLEATLQTVKDTLARQGVLR
jgi:thymidylate kinase